MEDIKEEEEICLKNNNEEILRQSHPGEYNGNLKFQSKIIIIKEVENLLKSIQKKKGIDYLNLFNICSPYFVVTILFSFFLFYTLNVTDIICALSLFFILICMIFLQYKRKKYKADTYEIKLREILEVYKKNTDSEEEEDKDSQKNRLHKKTYDSLSYCFTQVLRRKNKKNSFQSTPNVLLAKGDVIRILPGNKAPAKMQSLSEPNFQLEKGELLKSKNENIPENANLKEYFTEELGFKKFKVLETPIVNEIKTLLRNIEEEEDSKPLLIDQRKMLYWKTINIILFLTLICSVSLSITWIVLENVNFAEILSHPVYMMICLTYICVPSLLKFMDAWCNSLLLSLSEKLQKADYNKQFRTNYFQFLQKKERKKKKMDLDEKEGHKDKKKIKKNQKSRTHIKGFTKVDTYYEEFNFSYWAIKDNWRRFKKMLLQGVAKKEDYVGILSYATILAFTDLEGIISENERYANELAVFDQYGKKVVIDLLHDPYVEFEQDIYVFEKKTSETTKYNALKKALAICMGNAQNPERGNKYEYLKPIFKLPSSLKKKVEQNSDEYFLHRFNKNEITPHLDCMCSLSFRLGLNPDERKNLFPTFSFWDIKNRDECNLDQRQREVEIGYKDDNDTESHNAVKSNKVRRKSVRGKNGKQLFDIESVSQYASDGQLSMRSSNNDLMKDVEEIKKEHSAAEIANNHFAEMRKRKQYVKEQAKVHHIVSTICKDLQVRQFDDSNKSSGIKYHLFSRGDPHMLLQFCGDYWNGNSVSPISHNNRANIFQAVKDIARQWSLNDLDAVGFAYKPAIPSIYEYVESRGYEKASSKSDIELLQKQQNNQIFLGMVGIKEHSKREINEIFKSFGNEGAGIRCVMFCKEGPIETKNLGSEIGLNTDWNTCISLSDDSMNELINQEGNLVLPYGIKGIREHLKTVDQIPLQVPMFCDSTPDNITEMIKMYQENGEVVVCIGNVFNIENIKIFHQADLSIGMMVAPSQRCIGCKGLCRGFTAMRTYTPNKLENLAFSLNSLPCAFNYSANTNIYSLYTLFRESRRLKNGQQQCLLMTVFLYMMILGSKLVDISLGLPSNMSNFMTLIICFICIPLLALTFLFRPMSNNIMKRHSINRRYSHFVQYYKKMVRFYIIKIIISFLIIEIAYLLNYYFMLKRYAEKFPDQMNGLKDVGFSDLEHILWGSLYKLRDEHQYWDHKVQVNQIFMTFYIGVICLILAPGFEHERYSVCKRRKILCKNNVFVVLMVIQSVLLFAYFFIGTCLVNTSDIYFPHYFYWIILVIHSSLLIGLEEVTKRIIRVQHDKDQTRLGFFYEIKLGMYSPK
ncbi:unnamed protein product [Moneuplotes crassus]|uniref:Cation-transporting P-type ATPase C-terminal domain-containing protein n=1 Tax=Euplotes crassus TaxID=5936 RepID=A0AAD1UF00_EUPCR|nr:unnamed protein product [Moneuplotes crassus]